MSEEELVYVEDGNMSTDEIQESNPIQNTKKNNILSNIGSAISDSTGSAFGGSISPLSKSMRAPGKKVPIASNDKQNNAKNFAANKAANMLLNKSGKGDKVPDALKKRNSSLPNLGNMGTSKNKDDNNNSLGSKLGMNSESQNAASDKQNDSSNSNITDKAKNVTKEAATKVAEKGGSAALQYFGVPKPLADIVAKEISGRVVKIILISTILSIGLFGLIIIALTVGISVYFEPIISGFEEVTKHLSPTTIDNIGLLDMRLNNNILILADEDDALNILGAETQNASGKSKLEIQREEFNKTLAKLASDPRYKNIQWNIALASVLYGVDSDRDIYDGYCEFEVLGVCIDEDAKETNDYNDAESNLKKIVKKLASGRSEYETYMKETYIPKYFSKKMQKENKTEEDILKEIYKMATIVGDLYPELVGGTYVSNICPGGINVLEGINSKRFPSANNLSLEEYVAGSLSSEYSSESEPELTKAMAIAIRSNIVKKLKGKEDANGSCTVENNTYFQTYREPTAFTTKIAEETAGMVLLFEDEVIMAYYSIFPGKDTDGFTSSTPCEDSVCSGGMCSAMLYKFPNKEKANFSVPQSYGGYKNVSSINNSHCHGISTIVASYYASSRSLTYDKILELFSSEGVTISKLASVASGGQSLPVEIPTGPQNWRNYTSRVYQYSAKYVNGSWDGKSYSYHFGIDFTNFPGGSSGKPVYAIAPGTVIDAGWNYYGYGNYVQMGHDVDGDGAYDLISIYAHMLNRPLVSTNDIVQGGQQLGQIGSTGNSSGPHLHFELRRPGGGRTEAEYNIIKPHDIMDRIARGEQWYAK